MVRSAPAMLAQSSSPKKGWYAHRELQNARPYSRWPQSSQMGLKQIGHLCIKISSSVFWQVTQPMGPQTGDSEREYSMRGAPGSVVD